VNASVPLSLSDVIAVTAFLAATEAYHSLAK